MSIQRYRLIDALRLAGTRGLDRGWLYLSDGAVSANLECILVTEADQELNARGLAVSAVRLGFTREGLDTDTLEGTFDCAKQFMDPPSDDLLVESFSYYLEFDAFLPEPGFRPSA
jgi:hypothetical protein